MDTHTHPQVRLYIGVSLDGYIAAPDHTPAWEGVDGQNEVDPVMYGYDEFMREISAVVMGRTTYDGCIAAFADQWPWTDKQVFVLTSRPLSETRPPGVRGWRNGAAALLDHLRSLHLPGHIKLMGGAQAIEAF